MNLVLQEVARRDALTKIVDRLIATYIRAVKNCHTRLKRGRVHELVADYLKVRVNNDIRIIVNKRMEEAGFELTTLHGNRYYRHAVIMRDGVITEGIKGMKR